MKNSLLLLALGSALSLTATLPTAAAVLDTDPIDLHITHETTRDQLAEMQQSLYAQGVSFRYEHIRWVQGHLTEIYISVTNEDGENRTAHFVEISPEMDIRVLIDGATFCLGTACE
jgi:hypothetical protein